MIFSRPVSSESRRLIVERLEKRCLLSADFFGLDLDFEQDSFFQRTRGGDDSFEHRHEDRSDSLRQRDSHREDRHEREGGRESRNQHGISSHDFDNDAIPVLDNRFTANTAGVVEQSAAPTRTFVVSIITVPISSITFLVPNTSQVFESSDAPMAPAGLMLQQPSRSPIDPTTGNLEERTTEVADDEAVTTNTTVVDATSTNGTTLVSTTPAVTRFDRSISLADTNWWTTNPHDALFTEAAEIDESEIGRWLNRVDQLNDQFLELDRAFDELARERSQTMDSNLGVTLQSQQPDQQPNPWLKQSEGILLIGEAGHDHATVDDVQQGNIVAEGWTVGIGFHRALEIAQSESYSGQLMATIQRPVDCGAIHVSSDDSERNEVIETTTDSSSQVVGVAVCVVGIHYLRTRNQTRQSLAARR